LLARFILCFIQDVQSDGCVQIPEREKRKKQRKTNFLYCKNKFLFEIEKLGLSLQHENI
jgi:hypothetical protein